jgi:hypothetical protein
MLAFIQSQRSIVERLIRHIETPSFVDLIVRIIQLDEHPAGAGVLEVCRSVVAEHCSSHSMASSGCRKRILWAASSRYSRPIIVLTSIL